MDLYSASDVIIDASRTWFYKSVVFVCFFTYMPKITLWKWMEEIGGSRASD